MDDITRENNDTPTATEHMPPNDPCHDYDFTINVIDLYELKHEVKIPRDATQTAPIAAALAGYLVTSPERPSLAVSWKTLELYRQLRRRKSSLSIETYAKVICDLYQVGVVTVDKRTY